MTTTITIANQKGGVGKTTTAVTLAHGLALMGNLVMLIDLDPQGQAAIALGYHKGPGVFNWLVSHQPLVDCLTLIRPNLLLLHGNEDTSTAQIVMSVQQKPLDAIKRKLPHSTNLNYILIDTSPSLGGLQERALYAADLILIPTATRYLSADAVAATYTTINSNQSAGWTGRLLGILPTMYDSTNESRHTLADLHTTYNSAVLNPIHTAIVLATASAEGKTIWEISPDSRAGHEYASLLRLIP